jgi:hypothetical protein
MPNLIFPDDDIINKPDDIIRSDVTILFGRHVSSSFILRGGQKSRNEDLRAKVTRTRRHTPTRNLTACHA